MAEVLLLCPFSQSPNIALGGHVPTLLQGWVGRALIFLFTLVPVVYFQGPHVFLP